jgi:hypothetical protein
MLELIDKWGTFCFWGTGESCTINYLIYALFLGALFIFVYYSKSKNIGEEKKKS